LKLVTDEGSFKKGVDTLGKFPGLLKAGITGAVGLAAGMVALATTTATAMSKLDAQARTLGMSARNLDNWRGAVSLAGGDADSFVDSMVNMNEAFRNLKIGEVKNDFITATGMSGANFAKLQGMNNDERLRSIWGALEKVTDPQKQQALIEKIFGANGVQLFSLLQAKGQTLTGNFANASSINPLTDKDYKAAVEGDKQQREITQNLEKQFQNLGLKIENALLPALTKLADWFGTHQKELDDFAKAVGDATTSLVSLLGFLFEKDPQKQKDQGAAWMLGGPAQLAAFRDMERLQGIKPESAGESFLFMSPAWHNLATAMADSDLANEQIDALKNKGNKTAFRQYATALEASGMGIAARYANQENLAGGLNSKPNVNISVTVDKAGNVTVKDTDTGKILQTVQKGSDTAQAVSGLR
jgi:hypothetical protein